MYLGVLLFLGKMHLCRHTGVCVLRTEIETCSWKSKMKHVGKYDVHLGILLGVSIYVTEYTLFKQNPNIAPSITPP